MMEEETENPIPLLPVYYLLNDICLWTIFFSWCHFDCPCHFFGTISSPVSKKSAALTMKRRLNWIKRFRLRFESEHADPWVTSETSTAELTVFSVCSPGSVLPDESTRAPPVKAVRMVPAIHTGQRKRKHRVAQTVFVQGSATLVLQWSASSVCPCRTV